MNANDTMLLDATLRARHAASLEHLSPRVQAQLAQRRNAALRGNVARRGHGVRYAVAGFAALGALAIGLRLGMAPAPVPTPAMPTIASSVATTTPAATILDEDPEFYAWLASPDAQRLALE